MNLPPSIAAAPARTSKGPLRAWIAWAPVWIAFAVLGQVALLGLRPAMAERRKLAEAESQLRARIEREERQAAELERLERAQNDPIFLERERRALRASKPAGDDAAGSGADSEASSGTGSAPAPGGDEDAPTQEPRRDS
jgi:hypothetical protein